MYARLASWVGDKRWFRPVVRRVLPPVDKMLARAGWRATPWPTLILATRGRSSGRRHETPLYFVEHAGSEAVIGSNYGNDEPDWSLNLRSDPRCTIRMNRRQAKAQARLAHTDEWQPVFEKFAAFYPNYRNYLERADRAVPIWVLEGVT